MKGLDKSILNFLKEDAFDKDVTSSLMRREKCIAEIKVNEECVLAGMEEARKIFEFVGAKVLFSRNDGEKCREGEVVLRVEGLNTKLMPVERTVLNLLGRMSGVATACAKAFAITKRYNVKPAITRKTMPGMREYDKKAARIGGAWPHRKDLSEMVLLKENHLFFFKNVGEAIKAARKTYRDIKVEAEAESIGEAIEAAKAGADIVMLDDFSLVEARKAIKVLRGYPVQIELSGGITFENLEEYASLRPDIISMGCLTKSAPMVDFSMRVIA